MVTKARSLRFETAAYGSEADRSSLQTAVDYPSDAGIFRKNTAAARQYSLAPEKLANRYLAASAKRQFELIANFSDYYFGISMGSRLAMAFDGSLMGQY